MGIMFWKWFSLPSGLTKCQAAELFPSLIGRYFQRAFGRFGNAGRLISEELIQANLMRRLLLFRCSWSMSNTTAEACLSQSLRLNEGVCSRSAATYILHYTVRHMTTQPADKTARVSTLLSPFSWCIATLITHLSQFFFPNGGQGEIKKMAPSNMVYVTVMAVWAVRRAAASHWPNVCLCSAASYINRDQTHIFLSLS